ncbi:MAG: IS3 family transposase [Burkholderiales bacterium]
MENTSWINIAIACKCLGVAKASYYYWLNTAEIRAAKLAEEDKIVAEIKQVFRASRKSYGYRKITKTLTKQGNFVNHKKVLKLMRKHNLRSRVVKKFKATTYSKHDLAIFPNLLNRQFRVPKPNYAWVSDITYCWTQEGWLYLATVIDLFANKLVGYAMSDRINNALVIKALSKALQTRGYPRGIIVHSDRGSQYASNAYKSLLKANNLLGSMSRKGNCWDNAVAEGFFSLIKKESLNHYNFKTRQEAKLVIFDYVEGWYNNHRIHSKINYLTPDKFEELNNNQLVA